MLCLRQFKAVNVVVYTMSVAVLVIMAVPLALRSDSRPSKALILAQQHLLARALQVRSNVQKGLLYALIDSFVLTILHL